MSAGGLLNIPCLGRQFHLGMLYDCRNENIIPGKKLWDSDKLKSSMAARPQPYSNFEIIAEDTLSKKSFSLGIDAKLKLSFMGGLLKVSGAAKYMDDRKSSERQARVTLKYTSTTRFEELTMEQIGHIQYPKILDDVDATHVVCGVTYGSDAFFVFDCSLDTNEEIRNVQGNMEVAIKAIPGLGDISASASLKIEDSELKKTEKFSCKFYGDLILKSTPSTFQDAVQVYKDLPNLLNGSDGDQSVPKKAILYPLSKLDSRPQKIIRSISTNLISKVEKIMESIHDYQVKVSDLKRLDTCSAFVGIDDQLTHFVEMVNRFKLKFEGEISVLLPKIRGTGVQEKELSDLISSVSKSPFSPRQMQAYTRGIERVIKVLAQHVKNLRKYSIIRCAFTSSDDDILSLSADFQYKFVVCFAFNMTTKESPYVMRMEEYLSTQQLLPCDEKEFYEDTDLLQGLAMQVQRYCEFVQANCDKKDLTFAMTDSNEDAESSGPAVILYSNGIAEDFEPPSKPRNVTTKGVTCDSVHLEWTSPEYGENSIISYNVFYSTDKELKHRTALSVAASELSIDIKGLFPSTMYYFKVQAVTKAGVSVECDCHSITTKAKPLVRPAERIIQKSTIIDQSEPMCYQLPLKLIVGHDADGLYKYDIGARRRAGVVKPEKVMIVLGATGAGKSTLINGIANYVLGVDWKDNFRFKIISDESKGKNKEECSQAHSQTRDITAYTLDDTILPYTLTIIDTPGFGDTGGIENDKKIVKQIKKFFSVRGKDGIDQLHGIGFVTQASLARLTQTQRYVFDSVLALFGHDVKDIIFLMTTFADASHPPVLEAVKAAAIPYSASFKFNNSAVFASKDPVNEEFNQMFWKMGTRSFESFFDCVSKAESKSLKLTRQVLNEREQLENLIPKLQQEISIGLAKLDEIQQDERAIKQFKDQIDDNKGFQYEVIISQPYQDKLPAGIHTTTCMTCNRTCHDDCAYANNEDKARCCAISNGYCTACPQKCYWDKHVNLPYVIKHRQVKQKKTYENLKSNYDTAIQGVSRSEAMLAENEMVFFDVQRAVFDLIALARKSVKRLDEIALKPNPLSEVEYIDLLIETEKADHSDGWMERVQQYIEIRKNAVLLNQINLPIDDPKCIDHLEILINKEEKKSDKDRDEDQLSIYKKFCSLLKRAKKWWNKEQPQHV